MENTGKLCPISKKPTLKSRPTGWRLSWPARFRKLDSTKKLWQSWPESKSRRGRNLNTAFVEGRQTSMRAFLAVIVAAAAAFGGQAAAQSPENQGIQRPVRQQEIDRLKRQIDED